MDPCPSSLHHATDALLLTSWASHFPGAGARFAACDMLSEVHTAVMLSRLTILCSLAVGLKSFSSCMQIQSAEPCAALQTLSGLHMMLQACRHTHPLCQTLNFHHSSLISGQGMVFTCVIALSSAVYLPLPPLQPSWLCELRVAY